MWYLWGCSTAGTEARGSILHWNIDFHFHYCMVSHTSILASPWKHENFHINKRKLLTFFSWTSPLSMSTRSLPYRLSLCLMQFATVFRCTARDSSSRSVAAFSSLNFAVSFLTDNRHCSSTSCHRDTSVTLGRKYIWSEHMTSAISNNLEWEFKWSHPFE